MGMPGRNRQSNRIGMPEEGFMFWREEGMAVIGFGGVFE
jgi:hypothetical protein